MLDFGLLFISKGVTLENKTKVISADLLDLDFDFEDIIIMFGNI